MSEGKATAHANIALVKYWGKRDAGLNLPAKGSLSLTLDALSTTTNVSFDDELADDEIIIDGVVATGSARLRVVGFLDLLRSRASFDGRARVESTSNFPAASGLASSASAFAALAAAGAKAAKLDLDSRELSRLARQGSGSAARSVFGGFVRMHSGDRDEDAWAEPIASQWPRSLRMIVAIVGSGGAKKHASRDAMQHCAATSPLYQGWLDTVDSDLEDAHSAIQACDLRGLGTIMEASALAMHASMWAARPPICYWLPPTLAIISEVTSLREQGLECYHTMDAGPHVKVLTAAANAEAIASRLATIEGVGRVVVSGAGPGVT